MAPLHTWHTSKPHLMKLFIDRLPVIGVRQYSFVHSASGSRIIFTLPSPQGPPSGALERPGASFAQNFATTSTTLSPLAFSLSIFSEDLPRHRVLNRKEIYCFQSDTFNSDQPAAAMNHLSLVLSHKPSPTDNHPWAISQWTSCCSEDAQGVSPEFSRLWAVLQDLSTFFFSVFPRQTQSFLSRSYPALDQTWEYLDF